MLLWESIGKEYIHYFTRGNTHNVFRLPIPCVTWISSQRDWNGDTFLKLTLSISRFFPRSRESKPETLACPKRRATAVSNLDQFDQAVASNVKFNSFLPNSIIEKCVERAN